MFGESLLVAPVFHSSTATFYLPAGKWTDIWTDTVTTGPEWVTIESYPLDLIPVYVKENSVLLLGPEDVQVPDYEYSKVELEVRCYQLSGDVEVEVPVGKGAGIAGVVKVSKDGEVDGGEIKAVKGKATVGANVI